jgi:hypothetical protein
MTDHIHHIRHVVEATTPRWTFKGGMREAAREALVLSYPVFMPKPGTHHMHDPRSIVRHIRPKVFTDNQMSQIKYNYYYINSVSKDYDDSQWNGTAEDSIIPQERQPGQHVA